MKRRDQNRAIENWERIKKTVLEMDADFMQAIMRGSDESVTRQSLRLADDDPSWGTPPTSYADTTGELAVSEETTDGVEKNVETLATHLQSALNAIKTLVKVQQTEESKKMSQPCLACGDMALRIVSGFDMKCYNRWVRGGKQDRSEFIHMVSREHTAKTNVDSDLPAETE